MVRKENLVVVVVARLSYARLVKVLRAFDADCLLLLEQALGDRLN